MNTLGYRITDQNGRSFELLIDDESLGALVGASDHALPFWLVEEGIPIFPPFEPSEERDHRIVAVCSCGEFSCANTRCRVEVGPDLVTFGDFEGSVSAEGRMQRYIFSRSNFDAVDAEIARHAGAYATGGCGPL